ncbi:MAG: rhodanese-like domain-containing protein [Chitinophagaceae bacterium]|nr:rhodanese-like domain-containing protein [Oligoflexus sp.]
MSSGKYPSITVEELYQISQNAGPFHLLDVREDDEFAEYHATISRSLPLSRLMEGRAQDELRMPKDEPVYLICRSGRRSLTACDLLHHQGFTKLVNVTGGMEAWVAAGLAHARG